MKISRGSALLVDQVKRRGLVWTSITPTPLRKLMEQEKNYLRAKIESVHFVKHGDYLVTELRERGGK